MDHASSESVVSVNHLTKTFSNKNKLKSTFRETIMGILKPRDKQDGYFIALEDVSFSLKKGEVLGIMGDNGSGKSTLLKILSNITPPTSGSVRLKGSVSSILEIGTGFHPELSGRDNVILTSALLGVSKKDLTERFDKIVAFSELQEHIDTPVKYYSSGMFVRLAFSIISELRSDIILLDEAMAVGDTSFSLKSYDKIRQLAESGRTIIMVSHDPGIITQLCNSCMILKKGRVVDYGNTAEVVANYTEPAIIERFEKQKAEENLNREANQLVNKDIKMNYFNVIQKDGVKDEYLNDQPISIEFELEKKSTERVRLALAFNHQLTHPVFCATPSRNTNSNEVITNEAPGIYKYTLDLPRNFFNYGIYTIDLFLTNTNNQLIEKFMQVAHFKIIRLPENDDPKNDQSFLGGYPGPLAPIFNWKATRIT